MRSPIRMTLTILTLCAACAVDVSDEQAEQAELESSNLEALVCASYSASNSAHVQQSRAYVTVTYVRFRRVTTYYARGTNENLGTSSSVVSTLHQVGPASYSLSPSGCASGSDAAVPTDASVRADGSVPDASTPADAGSAASSGCGLAPPSSGGGKTLVVSGVSRSYVLAVPAGYDRSRAYPLVFGFHGLGGSGAQAQLYFGLQQATQGQAILVYPDATGSTRAWGITGSAASADLAFFDELVRSVSSSLCVDRNKIFAAGHSMGGYFSNTLGCARGNTLRAIAPVAGGGPYVGCDNGKVAAWLMASRDDPTVSYSAGEASRNHWLGKNSCAASTRPVGPSACVAYDGCDPAHPVHWCLERTGGHSWPSYAGQAIWSFFRAL